MKPFLAILVVALALPVSAFARPADLRNDPQVTSGSLHVTVRGTDVAAPDQQSPIRPASVRATPPRGDSFDWASASIGAAVTIVMLAAMLGMTAVIRRRRHTSLATL